MTECILYKAGFKWFMKVVGKHVVYFNNICVISKWFLDVTVPYTKWIYT